MSDATRLRKPRLFVQVADWATIAPLQYVDPQGGWSFHWCEGGDWRWMGRPMDTVQRAFIRETHVEVPL